MRKTRQLAMNNSKTNTKHSRKKYKASKVHTRMIKISSEIENRSSNLQSKLLKNSKRSNQKSKKVRSNTRKNTKSNLISIQTTNDPQ